MPAPRPRMHTTALLLALLGGGSAGLAEVRWRETPTHRVKVKSEEGRVVGEWWFPRDKSPGPDGEPPPVIELRYRDTPAGRVEVRLEGGREVSRRRLPAPDPRPAPAKRVPPPQAQPGRFPELDAEAERLAAEARRLQERGEDPLAFAAVLTRLGDVHTRREDFDAARTSLLQALAVYEDAGAGELPQAADLHAGLARIDGLRGRTDAARERLEDAFAIHVGYHGFEHPAVANVLYLMALLEHEEGQLADAERLYLRALEVFLAAGRPGHPACLKAHRFYARLLRTQGRRYEAESYERRAAALARGELPAETRGPAGEIPRFDLDAAMPGEDPGGRESLLR